MNDHALTDASRFSGMGLDARYTSPDVTRKPPVGPSDGMPAGRQLPRPPPQHALPAVLRHLPPATAQAATAGVFSAGLPSAGQAGTAPIPLDAWPDGSLVPAAKRLLDDLEEREPRTHHGTKVAVLMQGLGLRMRAATCLLSALTTRSGIYPVLHALCWNSTQATPLVRATSGEWSTDALNALMDYQDRKTQEGGRPIAPPTGDDFPGCRRELRSFLNAWGGFIWGKINIKQFRAGGDTRKINLALTNAGAFQSHGVYMNVSELLENVPNSPHDIKVLALFNARANTYISDWPLENIRRDSKVALRTLVLSHLEIENRILDAMWKAQNAPGAQAGMVFTAEPFTSMGYPLRYLKRRMEALIKRRLLVRVPGQGYRPVLPGEATGRKKQASSTRAPGQPPVKKRREERAGTAPSGTGAAAATPTAATSTATIIIEPTGSRTPPNVPDVPKTPPAGEPANPRQGASPVGLWHWLDTTDMADTVDITGPLSPGPGLPVVFAPTGRAGAAPQAPQAPQAPKKSVKLRVTAALDSLSRPCGSAADTPPPGWPDGSLMAAAQEYLDALAVRNPRCSYKDKTALLKTQFGLAPKPAHCLMTAISTPAISLAARALCWNITRQTRLTPCTPDNFGIPGKPGQASPQALNMLMTYQDTLVQDGRPIRPPIHEDFPPPATKNLQEHLTIWANLIWGKANLKKSKIGVHVKGIDEALTKYGAFESRGVFMPVSLLLKAGEEHKAFNQKVIDGFKNNANWYVTDDRYDCGRNSRVAIRAVVRTHAEIEHAMRQAMEHAPAGAVFDTAFFQYMGYPPGYMTRRLYNVLGRHIRFSGAGEPDPGSPPSGTDTSPDAVQTPPAWIASTA